MPGAHQNDRLARFNSDQLAERFGINDRTLSRILQAPGVDHDKAAGGYELISATRAVIAHFKGLSERVNVATAEALRRRNEAQAGNEEMELAKREGVTCMRSDYLSNYADAIAQGVRNISALRCIDDKQKAAVFEAMREVQLSDLEK